MHQLFYLALDFAIRVQLVRQFQQLQARAVGAAEVDSTIGDRIFLQYRQQLGATFGGGG
jgi:hypothetical protein